MKTDNGITLISLIVTVVILIILSSIAIGTGTNSIKNMKLQGFNYELQQVQGKVDAIYEKIKLGQTEYIILGSNITESEDAMQTLKTVKNIDYSNIAEEDKDEYYYEDTNTMYRYLTEADVKQFLSISSNPGDMIINFITKEVISVEGFEDDDTTYYKLSDIDDSYISEGNALEEMVDLAYRLLPKEYQQVEYIESTGTQWINTGVKADNNTEIRCKFNIDDNRTSWIGVFGERNSSDRNALNLWFYNSYYYAGVGSSYPQICNAEDKDYEIFLNCERIIVNGEDVSLDENVGVSNANINIFAIGTGTTDVYGNKVYAKFYYFKIYKSGDLVCNFIPCYCTTTVTNVDGASCEAGTIGLYDTVEGKFYTNKGTGTFVKGADV